MRQLSSFLIIYNMLLVAKAFLKTKIIPFSGESGSPDCCIFDFTNLYAARVAARVQVCIMTIMNLM
jgi:hypothetical protein